MRSVACLTAVVGGLFMSGEATPTHPVGISNPQQGGLGNALGVPIQGNSLIVVAPKSRDSLAAWSAQTGVWARIPIKPAEQDAIVPIVGSRVAAARIGQMVYGYGAESGKWHWIKMETQAVPSVGNDEVTVRDGDWYYAMSLSSGKWSGVNLKTGEIR